MDFRIGTLQENTITKATQTVCFEKACRRSPTYKKDAKARIHVEILKKFRPVDQVIPIASQMIYVGCCLVNFQDCLCK